MSKKVIATSAAPAAIGPYSQGTVGNGILCISGQLPLNPATGEMPATIEEQTAQAMENVIAIAKAAGAGKEDILRCGLFIRDMGKFADINKVYATFFEGEPPARFVIEVSALPKDAMVEIEAIVMVAK